METSKENASFSLLDKDERVHTRVMQILRWIGSAALFAALTVVFFAPISLLFTHILLPGSEDAPQFVLSLPKLDPRWVAFVPLILAVVATGVVYKKLVPLIGKHIQSDRYRHEKNLHLYQKVHAAYMRRLDDFMDPIQDVDILLRCDKYIAEERQRRIVRLIDERLCDSDLATRLRTAYTLLSLDTTQGYLDETKAWAKLIIGQQTGTFLTAIKSGRCDKNKETRKAVMWCYAYQQQLAVNSKNPCAHINNVNEFYEWLAPNFSFETNGLDDCDHDDVVMWYKLWFDSSKIFPCRSFAPPHFFKRAEKARKKFLPACHLRPKGFGKHGEKQR